MASTDFAQRRGLIEAYFDRTAFEAWRQLTSDAPVSRIRATVRAGRERMRALLLSWLPADFDGASLLDAGCGTGALAIEAARRGAAVTAIDVSVNLIGIARERIPGYLGGGSVDFRVGDMLEPDCGELDHVVAMDSLIHYETPDMLTALVRLTGLARNSVLVTVAPRTPALALMHGVGKLFPRQDRAPAIVPTSIDRLVGRINAEPALGAWRIGRSERVMSGFYTSHAIELVRR